LELALDYCQSVGVALRNLIQSCCLGVGRLSASYGLLQCSGNFFTESYGIGPLLGGNLGQAAICLGKLVYRLGGIEVGVVQIANKAQRA